MVCESCAFVWRRRVGLPERVILQCARYGRKPCLDGVGSLRCGGGGYVSKDSPQVRQPGGGAASRDPNIWGAQP